MKIFRGPARPLAVLGPRANLGSPVHPTRASLGSPVHPTRPNLGSPCRYPQSNLGSQRPLTVQVPPDEPGFTDVFSTKCCNLPMDSVVLSCHVRFQPRSGRPADIALRAAAGQGRQPLPLFAPQALENRVCPCARAPVLQCRVGTACSCACSAPTAHSTPGSGTAREFRTAGPAPRAPRTPAGPGHPRGGIPWPGGVPGGPCWPGALDIENA